MDMNELEQLEHGMLPKPTHDELARQQFARSFKEHIVAKIHPGNRVAYEKRVQPAIEKTTGKAPVDRSEEHTSELQSRSDLVCRLLLEKKK